METRASYVAVGSFVLAVIFGLVVFATWLGKISIDSESDSYLIYFSGAVTGLQVGSPVRYRGIPVGTVTDIRIDPTNVERVQVTVEVTPGTPIVVSNVATLAIQGITGASFVQIVGGMQGDPLLEPEDDKDLAVIPSQPSSLAELLENFPRLLESATRLADAATKFLSEENVESVTSILANVDDLTRTLSDRSEEIASAVERLESLAVNVDGIVSEARVDLARLSDRVDSTLLTVDEELALTSVEIRELANAATATSNQITAFVRENRPGIREFTNGGINEFTLMVQELRTLANNLSRVAVRIENDPAQFLFGSSEQGVRVE